MLSISTRHKKIRIYFMYVRGCQEEPLSKTNNNTMSRLITQIIRNIVIRFLYGTSHFIVISLSLLPFILSFPPFSRICLIHKQFPCRRRHRQFPIITHLQRPDDELLSRLGQFHPELRLPHNCETPRGILTQKTRCDYECKRNKEGMQTKR